MIAHLAIGLSLMCAGASAAGQADIIEDKAKYGKASYYKGAADTTNIFLGACHDVTELTAVETVWDGFDDNTLCQCDVALNAVAGTAYKTTTGGQLPISTANPLVIPYKVCADSGATTDGAAGTKPGSSKCGGCTKLGTVKDAVQRKITVYSTDSAIYSGAKDTVNLFLADCTKVTLPKAADAIKASIPFPNPCQCNLVQQVQTAQGTKYKTAPTGADISSANALIIDFDVCMASGAVASGTNAPTGTACGSCEKALTTVSTSTGTTTGTKPPGSAAATLIAGFSAMLCSLLLQFNGRK